MKTPTERLDLLVEHTGLKLGAIAKKCGYERPQAFYDVYKGKAKKISEKMASSIIKVFPDIREVWLLTGEGEMLKTDTPKSGVSTEEGGVISIPRDAWEVIRNQSASLKAKDEQLGMLAASLKAKDDQINTLISQSKSEREETVQALKNTISTLEKELAKKGEDAGYPSHVAIRADTE